MKKNKKKLLSIVSTLFGIVALCGLFSLSVLSHDQKKIETKAEDLLVETVSNTNINLQYHPDSLTKDEDDEIIREIHEEATNSLRFNYDVSLYENRDLAYNRYKLYFNIRSSVYVGSLDSTYSLYSNGSTNLTGYTDYLLDVSSFNIGLYLEYFDIRMGTKYSDYYRSNVVYLYYELAFSMVNRLNDAFDGNLFVQGDFGTMLCWPYSNAQEQVIAGLTATLALSNFPFNMTNNGEIIQPTRPHLLLNDIYFSSMATDYDIGFNIGYNQGYNQGVQDGSITGYSNGYAYGFEQGVLSQQTFIDTAYNNGYSVGLAEGMSSDSTVVGIFSGILQVGMLPINMFLTMFNFNILGINVSSFISALLTVCITIIVVKTVMGGSAGGGKE